MVFGLTLITEQSSPSFFTVTLPRLLARTVLTHGVFLTLGAERSLPAFTAPATHTATGQRSLEGEPPKPPVCTRRTVLYETEVWEYRVLTHTLRGWSSCR